MVRIYYQPYDIAGIKKVLIVINLSIYGLHIIRPYPLAISSERVCLWKRQALLFCTRFSSVEVTTCQELDVAGIKAVMRSL